MERREAVMAAMETISYSQFRQNLSDYLKGCAQLGRRFVVSRNDTPEAVVVSMDEWKSIMETIAVLSNPKLIQQIVNSQDDIAAGRVESAESAFDELLEDD
jgi:antitoxin YefM